MICEWENEKAKNEFSNNEIYKGKIINSKKQGKGIYYYNNGDRYEGEYNKNTEGIYYYKNEINVKENTIMIV